MRPRRGWRGIDVYPVETLARLTTHFRDYHPIEPCQTVLELDADPPAYAAGFQDINGQEHLKRAGKQQRHGP